MSALRAARTGQESAAHTISIPDRTASGIGAHGCMRHLSARYVKWWMRTGIRAPYGNWGLEWGTWAPNSENVGPCTMLWKMKYRSDWPRHAAQPRPYVIFLANTLPRPLHRNVMVAGESQGACTLHI
jgi:hypothetical protein